MELATLPQKFIPVGQTFTSRGMRLTVIERPSSTEPSEACAGCAFASVSCPRLQCSAWDRRDGKNVWFKEVRDV